jgi:regulator of sirC expression with transglutaminase-like and TPR domain
MTADLQRFAEIMTREQFDLAEAGLLLAQDAYPEVDVAGGLATLDRMAGTVQARVAADAFPEQKAAVLNHYLFYELGFRGNDGDYFDPRNSYLNEVLERRTGIPITLSIIYLEVGRRLGLDVRGVSFPGHFLVKLLVSRGQLILDPFNRGDTLPVAELRRRLAQVLPREQAEQAPLDPFLASASRRDIIARVLRNLKHIYLKAEQLEAALDVLNRMLLVLPESAEELRDRGVVYQRLDCFRPALSDLQNYLRRRPDAPDSGDVRARVVELQRAARRLN